MTDQKPSDSKRRPALEWTVGGASALVLCAIVAFLGHEALFGDTSPPDLNASIERVEQVGGQTLIFVAVANAGDQAAAEVVLSATVETEPTQAAPKDISFDYVASHSVRRGAFLLDHANAKATDVHLAIQGYVKP